MPTNILPGPTSTKAYAAIIAEVVGSEGSYVAPTAQVPIDRYTLNQSGGTAGTGPFAGSRLANPAVISDELKISGDLSGPFTNVAALLNAAIAGAAGELPAYSLELNLGGATSARVAGALIEKYSLKGAVGSPLVTFTASFVAQSATSGATGTPTAAVITPFGLKSVAITGPALATDATAFEINIDSAARTQPVYNGSVIAKYIYATTFAVTGKMTAVASSAGDLATIAVGTTIAIVVTLTNSTGTKTLTLADCRLTKVGNGVQVGTLTMQDLEFLAVASAGVPITVA